MYRLVLITVMEAVEILYVWYPSFYFEIAIFLWYLPWNT